MSSALKDKPSICFVSPHPDDIELYCGGTLLDHAKKNERLSVIMMTYGGRGTSNPFLKGKPLEKIREQEARARYSLIDDLELIFAEFKDKQVIYSNESVERVLTILRTINPDIIYLPECNRKISERLHSDHLNTGKIILEASKQLDKIVTFRFYHSKDINKLVNIDKYYELNNEAIKFYKSQKGISVGPILTGLTRMHYHHNKKRCRWGKQIGALYAEGFRELI